MKRTPLILSAGIIICGIALAAFSPDMLSMVMTAIMCSIILLGTIFGIIPLTLFSSAFERGRNRVSEIRGQEKNEAWHSLAQSGKVFSQKKLDEVFKEYRIKTDAQLENDQIAGNIEDYFNDDSISILCWNSIMVQIPGTLTGMGILGTFIGLALGVGRIGFSSVDAAIESVQSLITGIEIAFYTSIAGVILSIMFNIVYRMAWTVCIRQMELFNRDFHKYIMPTVEEQERYIGRSDIKQILSRLDRIPKNTGFSLSNMSQGNNQGSQGSESLLMPQILKGLKEGEFTFFLQPKYDINTRIITGAEALIRWKHEKLGYVSPSVFIPVLERNGYITKIDQYIWEQTCAKIREWMDAGLRPVPISVNVSKTDIMAINVGEYILNTVNKYQIPPGSLGIEIAKNAYLEARETAKETEEFLLRHGFKVVLDGFDGNYFAIEGSNTVHTGAWKLDMRFTPHDSGLQGFLNETFSKSRSLGITLSAEGIETMEQVTFLRKCGCMEAQGYYFSKPVPIEEFLELTMAKGDEA